MAEMVTEQGVARAAASDSTKPASSIAGELKLHQFKSRVFSNQRLLRVWLPAGYDAPDNMGRRYPVLYLNDGQNLFDASTSYIGVEWQVDETADLLIREKRIPPIIVVGIDNAQSDRIKEYVPYPTPEIPLRRVQGKKYPDFLMKEVMPFIRRRYRIASGAANTGLGGSSLGALIALYTVIGHPNVFGHLLLESPSLFVGNGKVLRDSERNRRWPLRIFLGIGTQETGDAKRNQQVVEDVRRLEQILCQAGLTNERLRVDVEEGAPHSELAWAKRFPEALAFLFGH
jgi:enterochelin esterase-like enzyme